MIYMFNENKQYGLNTIIYHFTLKLICKTQCTITVIQFLLIYIKKIRFQKRPIFQTNNRLGNHGDSRTPRKWQPGFLLRSPMEHSGNFASICH